MSDPNDPVPPPDSPPLNGGRYGRPAQRRGASRSDAVPRMENVRVTAPDLARRAALEQTRSRLVITAGGFTALFSAVLAKLALATIVAPRYAASGGADGDRDRRRPSRTARSRRRCPASAR